MRQEGSFLNAIYKITGASSVFIETIRKLINQRS